MMMKKCVSFLLLLLCSSSLFAQQAKQPVRGYLDAATPPDFVAVVPPAPNPGDARDQQDQAVFHATRRLEGSARWELAQQDNESSVKALMLAFSCSVGAELTPQDAPRLAALLARLSKDSVAVNNAVKNQFGRKRPFVTASGNICIARSPELIGSYDYPSGHATLGWLTGLVLAEIAPDRVGPILARARAYGESRVICGVHNASSVDAGRTLAGAIFAAEQSAPAFRTDLAAAETEVKQLRSKGEAASAQQCAAERALTSSSPYSVASAPSGAQSSPTK